MIKPIVFVFSIAISFVHAKGPYRPPNLEEEIFNRRNLEIDQITRAALFASLVSVARDFNEEKHDVSYTLRSNALAIAGRLNPTSTTFREVDRDLRINGRTLMKETSKEDVVAKIYRGVRVLSRRKKNEDNLACASFCIDIALRLDPEGRLVEKFRDYQSSVGKADWLGLYEAPAGTSGFFVPRRRSSKERVNFILGGSADRFPMNESEIHCLTFRRASDGKRIGVAQPVLVKAVPLPGSGSLKLQTTQKVGNLVGKSLKEISELMRLRHRSKKIIPSNYGVDLTFGDPDQMIDSLSAEAGMCLVIDSLFAGRALDEKFGITGNVSPEGKFEPVGGIAGKIHAASEAGCRIVGIPRGNTQGVADFLLQFGLKEFVGVQIFSFETLDDVYSVASKDRRPEVRQAVAQFDKISQVVSSKGKASLKDTGLISQLKEVVAKMPNHQSAHLLLELAGGKEPKSFSEAASFHLIDIHLESVRSLIHRLLWLSDKTVSPDQAEALKKASDGLDEF